jgi:nanoRNase/pAp phosphatase (c-di-AMP/oligoRNAs hydrolase)
MADTRRRTPPASGAGVAAADNGGTRQALPVSDEPGARVQAFVEFLERHGHEKHVVALQDYPDPDAISCALAYRELAALRDVRVDIMYEGRVSHQENLALVHLLEIDLLRFSDALPLEGYDGAVFIDNQGSTTRLLDRLAKAGVPTLAVIDHHAPQRLLTAEFTDIRPVGAAATILTEYVRSGRILQLEPDNPLHVHLATALLHGLRSETNGFIGAGQPEYEAGGYLANFADPRLLESILSVQRSHGTMNVIRIALSGRVLRGGFSLAGVGYLHPADRDAIPQATDFLLTEENVHTACVYGILEGDGDREVVVGSVRTEKVTLDVDQFLKTALGSDLRGRYYGGGRSGAGGFEIPTGFLEGALDAEQARLKWETFDRQIRTRLLRSANVESAEDGPGE